MPNMDFWFISAIVFLAIGIPFWFVARKKNAGPEPVRSAYESGRYGESAYDSAHETWSERNKIANGGRSASRIVLALGVFLLAMSCWVQVPTNTIGIFTSFGKPVDARSNGFQGKLPWEKVVKFDASRQYLKFTGKGNDKDADEDGKEFPHIAVKMEREAKADVDVVIAWQMKAGTEAERRQAVELYRAHKTFDRLTENFMAANARSATQAVYDTINPLVPGKNATFAQLSSQLEDKLKELVGDEVTVISAQIVGVNYDDETDKRIAEMQAEYAKTDKAKQQEETNKAQSKANAALTNTLNELILQDNCIKGAIAAGANPGACLQPGWGSFGTANK